MREEAGEVEECVRIGGRILRQMDEVDRERCIEDGNSLLKVSELVQEVLVFRGRWLGRGRDS